MGNKTKYYAWDETIQAGGPATEDGQVQPENWDSEWQNLTMEKMLYKLQDELGGQLDDTDIHSALRESVISVVTHKR